MCHTARKVPVINKLQIPLFLVLAVAACSRLEQAFTLNAPSAVKFATSTYSTNVGTATSTVAPLEPVYGAKSCTATPALPAGLTVDNQTCAVIGTPTALSAPAEYTITAQNIYGSSTGTLTLEIIGIFYSVTTYNFYAGVAIAALSPTASGAITACAINPPLPAVLNFNTTTCAITGMPSSPQAAATYTVTATNAAGTSSASLSISVGATVTQPSMGVLPGNYATAQSVSLYSGTPGATLYYTTDGSTPTTASTLYSTAISVMANTTVRAIATKSGYTDSSVASATYTIGGAATYALGGWVSGLQAGNLLLQNNGGDTLTITGNGPFAFATPLASGATYSVSIFSKTTTQSCRVDVDNSGAATGGTMTAANLLSISVVCDGDLVPAATYVYTGPSQHATYTADYTTTDQATGRVWKSCAEGKSGATCGTGAFANISWMAAGLACLALNDANANAGYAGRKDWRLPTRNELISLLRGTTPDGVAFPSISTNLYWSSTTRWPASPTSAYSVQPAIGASDPNPKAGVMYCRCVAGP